MKQQRLNNDLMDNGKCPTIFKEGKANINIRKNINQVTEMLLLYPAEGLHGEQEQ